jgi:hypothetical protein
MITAQIQSQAEFYREFLVGRVVIDPAKYGIAKTRDEFISDMFDAFAGTYEGKITVDELLLHPQEALWFCGEIRRRYHYFDLPDDIILRALIGERKKGLH